MAHGTQANDLSIQLVQQRHAFPFGAAVKASFLVDDAHQVYQDFVFNNFNWAVLANALKWNHVERSEGNSQYDTAVAAISALQSHGLHVRGHNLFWAVDRHSPKWLLGKSHTCYINEMKRHINDIASHTNGTLDHWDVYNEALHGRYFEKHTGDPDIIQKMFHWLHVAQPQSKLFLNDYKIVTSNLFTTALKNQALQLLKDRVPLYGIGIQSHFKTSQIHKDIIKYRLDKVAEAGLKIWITEMTIFESNSTKKAAALEELLTLYFSHPAVEGVLLWGFWDGAIRDQERSLFTGPSITANAAGQKYLDLVKKTWWTDYTHTITSGHVLHTSVFKGDYQLLVKHNGTTIHRENLVIDSARKDITIHVTDDHQVTQIAFG
ncbi:uncharacterized protein LOC134244820 [Saccostrea cucullata]|uniref:uncharacterized protein LOC134244820 n=1 Tax=Saccostrea cuccullata TaxID=36930 RepID=UPI002ED197A0